MSRFIFWFALIFLFLGVQGAWAEHFHFAEYDTDDVKFGPSDRTSYTWTFNLNTDTLYLWSINDYQNQNCDEDFVTITQGSNGEDLVEIESEWFLGHLSPSDVLDHVYLTMRFDDVNDSCCHGSNCSGDGEITLALDGTEIDYPLDQGNIFNKLDVLSYMENDHKLIVTITLENTNSSCCSGGCSCGGGCCGGGHNCCSCCDDISFTVDWVKLSGCYEPVPEPASLMLFGLGLAGVATLLRRKG